MLVLNVLGSMSPTRPRNGVWLTPGPLSIHPGSTRVARTQLPQEIVKGSSLPPADSSGQGSVSASAGTVPALRAAGHCEFRPTNGPPRQVTKRGHPFPAGCEADGARQMAACTRSPPTAQLLRPHLPSPSTRLSK